MLESEHRRVVVPADAELVADGLQAILRAAGVSYSEFLELLSSAFPAEAATVPDLQAAVDCSEAR